VRVQAELKKAGTTTQQINMKALRSKLNRGIARFRTLQSTYTPGAIQVLAKQLEPAEELAESVPLMLPSSLEVAECEGRGCALGVLEIEDSLRSPVSYSAPSAAQPTSHQVAFLALQEAQHLTSRNEHTVTHDCSSEREQNSVALREIPNGVDRTPSYRKWGHIKGGVAKVAERGYLLHAGPRGAVVECRETEEGDGAAVE
jgi:hypothetical protein